MKKVFTVLGLVFLVNVAFAQKEYEKGDVLLNLGIGAGYYYAGGMPIVASAEFAINDAISIGPYLGFTSWGHRVGGYRWNHTFIDFGARGSYHFSKHIDMNTDKLDLYGGVQLGYAVSSYTENTGITYSNQYPSTLRGGIFGGARWYFSENFAANAEVGIAVTPLLVGLTFKL